MSGLVALVFAHAGGFSWDEALLVLAPIVAIAAVFFLANKRAKNQQVQRDANDPAAGDDDP